MSFEVIDFGCWLNIVEGVLMVCSLVGVDDIIVINSCVVIGEVVW